MKNLQETINLLMERMSRLEEDAADAKANKEAIRLLNERLTKLKQVSGSSPLVGPAPLAKFARKRR